MGAQPRAVPKAGPVRAHETTVANDIGSQNGGETTFQGHSPSEKSSLEVS